ncbi:MAG: hypothetical protein DYG94_10645 [Leptolyngbya sp. PLA3]|nr:MAG: hypothetical protein EDM82_09210 [Cyanobacteria bacterium CYA]MCE7969190.1 hypothetical protein [Leptolyngbya sp. PL-A3]
MDLEPGGSISPLRLCVLCRTASDGAGGHLVVLRDWLDARALLGCVVDVGDVVQRWVQIWIQDVDRVATSLRAYQSSLSNTILEERWARMVEAVEEICPQDLVRTGFEREAAPALFLDPLRGKVKPLMHEASGMPFEVCRDDGLLRERGLALFSTTLHRYLYIEALGLESPFVAATEGAPGSDVHPLASKMTGINRDLISLNAGGGRMLVRRYSPISMGQFIEVLGGATWPGVAHGSGLVHIDNESIEAEQRGGESIDPDRFFLGRHGRWGRLVETLHLKMRLIADALGAVSQMASRTGRPLLNLSDESFQVEVWDRACGLPRLWTARAVLVDPGAAVALPIEGSRLSYFVSPEGLGRGIYRPQLGIESARGLCSLRFRQVTIDDDGSATIEGTFQTDERVKADGSDLVALQLNMAGERVEVFVRLESASAMASGELRFRSVPQRVGASAGKAMRAAEGVPMRDVTFEVLPLLSTPCDLYAIGVLAVKALLTGPDKSVAEALDEALSLARQASALHGELGGESAPALHDRIRLIFDADARWSGSLGPQRLTAEKLSPQEAFDLVPPELWWRVLAAVVRMFPGMGPDSICRDLGDSRGGGAHRVFGPAIEDVDDLLVRTRSLMLIDWRYNREVHSVIRGMRTQMIDMGVGIGR